jgi:small subunit ribosomal protein S1
VVAVGQHTAFVEIGEKGEAQIDLAEFRDPQSGEVTLAVGDMVEATVTDDGGSSGTIILKQTLGRGGHIPGELQQAFELGVPIEGVVTAENKGGFDIQIGSARAFCPRSQIDRKRGDIVGTDYIGQRFSFLITKIDADKRDVVVSRRTLLDEEAAERMRATMDSVREGAVLEGVVTNLQPFGAFVDVGGVEGMIHISQLAYGRVDQPSDVLEVGQKVRVKVVRIEEKPDGKRRIGLSMKELADDPWAEVVRDFPVGSTVRGRVRRLEPFGAFVELAPGLEGLVHISKITLDRRLSHARQALEIDQEVEATVLGVEPAKRRIALSLIEKVRGAREAEAARDRAEERDALAEQNRPQSLGSFAELLSRSRK